MCLFLCASLIPKYMHDAFTSPLNVLSCVISQRNTQTGSV